MDYKEKPLEAKVSMSNKMEDRPELTFWFERIDKTFFCCKEVEAWDLLKGRMQVKTDQGYKVPKHKYLGASDGTTYFGSVAKAKEIFKSEGLESAQAILREAHDKERENADINIKPRNLDIVGNGAFLMGNSNINL